MERAFAIIANTTFNPNTTYPAQTNVFVNLIAMGALSIFMILLNIYALVWSEATHKIEVAYALSKEEPWRFTEVERGIIASRVEGPAI